MPEPFTIEIKYLDVFLKAFHRFPKEIARALSQAGHMSADEVLKTKGLRNYPRAGKGSTPPAPYYKRGTGYIYASGRTDGRSERLGTQWYVKREGYKVRIGNRASYAKYVHDDDTQAKAMAGLGWLKLWATFTSKKAKITKVYQQMVDRTIRKLGL